MIAPAIDLLDCSLTLEVIFNLQIKNSYLLFRKNFRIILFSFVCIFDIVLFAAASFLVVGDKAETQQTEMIAKCLLFLAPHPEDARQNND